MQLLKEAVAKLHVVLLSQEVLPGNGCNAATLEATPKGSNASKASGRSICGLLTVIAFCENAFARHRFLIKLAHTVNSKPYSRTLVLLCCLMGRLACAAEDPKATKIKGRDAFFNNGFVPHLHIQLDEAALASLRRENRRYVRATVTEGESVYRDVGVHLKGGQGSFQPLSKKPSLTLNFGKFVRGQTFHGLGKFHLNNSFQDPTYLNEFIGTALFQAAGLPAARVTHARAQLNGRELGLYVLVEGFDKAFLKHHFGNATGNLYDGGSRQNENVTRPLERKSGEGQSDYSDLTALISAANEPNPDKRLAKLATILDMDRFYSFLALEIMANSWDGYAINRNNYWVYNDPVTQRFVFLPRGMDQLFDQPQSSLLPECLGAVASAVLNAPAGRQLYRQRCSMLLTNVFTVDRLTNLVDEAHRRVRNLLAELGPERAAQHEAAVGALRARIIRRVKHLERELNVPLLQLLVFDDSGEARLDGWRPQLDFGRAELPETDGSSPCLDIRCTSRHVSTVASWRTRVLLAAGRYRFQGRVKAVKVVPIADALYGGISLRVFGEAQFPLLVTGAKGGWQAVTRDFVVRSPHAETELCCEVLALGGSVCFERSSLTLVKNPSKH